MSKRVVYRVLNDDGIQNAATGQRWEKGNLLEGAALPPWWAEMLLKEGAVEVVNAPKRKAKAKS